jgi:16S rRNA (guanine1207-N2)-methyltransferase
VTPSQQDPATALMIEHLGSLDLGQRPLIVGDASGDIAAALARNPNCRASSWLRWAGGITPASSWPPPGPHSAAVIRLPKGKGAQVFAFGTSASVVSAGAPIALFGMNDEGIRSAARGLDAICEDIETKAVGHHARILMGRRRADFDVVRDLDDWRSQVSLPIAGVSRSWTIYPGLFAEGNIDAGTALLVSHLPGLRTDAHVLDYGSGTGIVAAHVQAACRSCALELLDADTLALAAAAQNVPSARIILGTSLADAGERYDLIISNPPIHHGVAEDRRVLDRLIADAPARLVAGGILQIVVQRRVAVVDALTRAFGHAQQVGATSRYSVFRAVRPLDPHARQEPTRSTRAEKK